MSERTHAAAVEAPAAEKPAPRMVQATSCATEHGVGNLQLMAGQKPAGAWPGSPGGNQASQRSAAIHEAARRGTSGASTELPHLDRIQRSFGRHDVRHVRAHTGADAKESAEQIGANAFATGDHVAFRDTPDLGTAAHEAAHVVQQRAGVHLSGGVGRAGDAHEQHADAVAALVVQGRSSEALLDEHEPHAGGGGVQRQCATCAAGAPCACGPVQLQPQPAGFVPEPDADPAQAKPAAETKTIKGWTFSADREAARAQLIEMWIGSDRKTVKDFVDNCDADDPEAKAISDRLDLPGAKTWDWQGGAPPPAPKAVPVHQTPPPTPADAIKSGVMPRLKIYDTIRAAFRSLTAYEGAFLSQFQSTAKSRLELILESSRKGVEAEQSRYGLDAEGKKSGKSSSEDVQKDLVEMAQHAAKLARLKRALNTELAQETANALAPGVQLAPAVGFGSGAKFPTTQGTSGIGRRLRFQQPYDEARAHAFRKWPVLAGFDPKALDGAPTEWERLAAGATKTKAGPEQLAMIQRDIETKLENIQTVKDHIGNGELIWELDVIVGGTKRVMNVAPGTIENRWIADYERKLKLDKDTKEKILLGITLALVAVTLIPSGGSSALVFAGAAATVGLAGLSTYQLVHEVQKYQLESAEANTTYDKALAIASEEPSLFPVAVAAVAVFFDVRGALHAFRGIKGLYRAALLKEPGAAEKLAARIDDLKPGAGKQMANELLKSAEATGDVVKTRAAMEADKLGELMHMPAGHEGVFSKLGKLFRCSPLCGQARDVYDAILRERPDLLAELNRLESGAIDAATVAARKPAAQKLLGELERIKQIQGLPDATLRQLLEVTPKTLAKELEREAAARFGSVKSALKSPGEIIGKAAEAPAMKGVDPGAWLAPENFKAFDAVNPKYGKGAKFSYELVEETYKGRKIWVVEQRIAGGKWYSVKTLSSARATEKLVKENVDLALKNAFDEAMNKAASIRDPSPVHGKDVYLRVIKDGPAEAIEIVVQIPIQNTRNAAAEIATAQKWADDARKAWPSIADLPTTTVTVRARP